MRIKILLVAIVALLTGAIYLTTDMNSKEEDANIIDQTDQEYLGEIFRLEEKRISPYVENLSIEFVLGRTLKYVDEAPPIVSVSSSDPIVLSADSTENKDPKKAFLFPINTKTGETGLTIDYRVFCCNSGPGAVCFFKEGRIIVPVTVADGGDETFEIKHMIDE
ncbi:MAG: hypothetical protein V3W18_01855 [candidate division Zixibacteria bacterium]